MSSVSIRDFLPDDALQVNALGLWAFAQFKDAYQDWPTFQARISNMSAFADAGEIIVAEAGGTIAGAVAYIGPGVPKADFFLPEWPIMRMLVVSPTARGLGIGRALVDECLRRARRDHAAVFALHTSELMEVALPMYQRMGFKWVASAPPIHGVAYGVYVKDLQALPDAE
jgi:ribosomal protein S18 acetylase RimI-like enzyme